MACAVLLREFQAYVKRHSDLLFIHHHIRDLKHGGQIFLQIDYAAMSAWEGHEGEIVQRSQLFQDAADCRPGQPPAGSQLRVSAAVAAEVMSIPATIINAGFTVIGIALLYIPVSSAYRRIG